MLKWEELMFSKMCKEAEEIQEKWKPKIEEYVRGFLGGLV